MAEPEKFLEVTRGEQYRTVNELFDRSRPTPSYYTLLFLSTLIITSGLLINNSAIVIGGMLVTPLLTPLLVGGLGLAVGELGAVRSSVWLVLKSFIAILAASFLLALIFGRPGTSSVLVENTVRSAMLYFIVAVSSGVAGALAWARKEISEVLPGIAISVSLVPPASLAGIWLSAFAFPEVRFYLLIFLFNLVGIMAGALVVFSLLRFYRLADWVHSRAEEESQQAVKEG